MLDIALLKMHNMSKIWYANDKFSLWKILVYDERAVENGIFNFFFFQNFPNFKWLMSKIFW